LSADDGTGLPKYVSTVTAETVIDESPGKQTITVRATDNTGAAQTADQVGNVPEGANGWHTVDFAVAET